MLHFFFISFGIFSGIEASIFIINSFSTDFFSYGNSLGIYWVIYGFGSLLGFPLGLALQTAYKLGKNKFTECSLEAFISRFLGFLFGFSFSYLLWKPLAFLLISKELFTIKSFLVLLGHILFGFFCAFNANIHSRYFLEFLIPKFVESLLVYQSLSKPATVRCIDTNSLLKHKLVSIFQTKFLEGPLILGSNILFFSKSLTESQNFKKQFYGEKAFSTINILKKQYQNQIVVEVNESNSRKNNLFEVLPIISKSKQHRTLVYSNTSIVKDTLNLMQLIKELRTPYLYRDILSLKLQKKGNRFGQGIGYLEDGTMVIVERGYQYIGREINVKVKKIRQRTSGRILFTYPQNSVLAFRNRKRKEKRRVSFEQKKLN